MATNGELVEFGLHDELGAWQGKKKRKQPCADAGSSAPKMPLYEIEWGGFLTNHLSHGLWALGALGAPAALVQRYATLYVSRLTPLPEAALPPPPSSDASRADITSSRCLPPGLEPPWAASEAEVVALRGQRRDYARQRAFFAQQTARNGADATLRRWLPELLPGLAGAALHPVIHVAVAIREGDDGLLAEGLAYLNHSFLGVAAGVADASEERAGETAGDDAERYVDQALARPPAPPVASSGRFQRAMAGLLGSADSATALRLASLGTSFQMQEDNMLDTAVRLYVGQGRNDYFLLHAVTASWGLGVVLSSAAGLQLPQRARQGAVRALAVAVAAAAWIQGVGEDSVAPQQGKVDPREALAAARASAATLGTESEPRNEHVYKLVAVATERLQQLAADQQRADGGDRAAAPPSQKVSADWAAAVAMAVTGGDFTGRGLGEKPTTKVDLGAAAQSMHQVQS